MIRHAAGRVDATAQDAALAFGIVALVLMEDGRQGEDDQIIPVGLVEKAAPVISPEASHAFAKLRVRVRPLSQQRGDAHKDKRRIVEAVLRGDLECLPGRWRRRNRPRAHSAIVGHDAQDSFGLPLRLRDRLRACNRLRAGLALWSRSLRGLLARTIGGGNRGLRLRGLGQRFRGIDRRARDRFL